MELSKRALGFLSRQYRIILSQNRLANVLGTCALSALMCATGLTTAAFVAPENAVADVIGVTIPAATTSWSSTGDISASNYGIFAPSSSDWISITLESGHTVTVGSATNSDNAFGIYAESTPDNNTSIFTNHGTINATSQNSAWGIQGTYVDTIINNGAITATVTGDNRRAYGIEATNASNSGTITVTITGTNGKAYGINAYDATNSGTIIAKGNALACGIYTYDQVAINSGTIEATATVGGGAAYGVYNASDVTNSGTVTVTAEGEDGTAYGIDAIDASNSGTVTVTAEGEDGTAYGIDAAEASNSDTVTVTADAEAYGIKATNASNRGTITATTTGANAEAYGINVYGNTINSGTIEATATGDGGTAYGVDADEASNSGTVTVTADAEAYGIKVYGNTINSGTIEATTTGDGGTAYGVDAIEASNSGTVTVTADAEAYGIKATNASNSGTVTVTADAEAYGIQATKIASNSGTITATTTGAKAYGIKANSGEATNSGIIDVTTTGANAEAYGIWATDATNSGTITATAEGEGSTAYGIWVLSDATNNDTITVWAKGESSEAIGMEAMHADNNGTITVWAPGDSADAYGMKASGENNGTINVWADGGNDTVQACGIYTLNGVTNNGTITVAINTGDPDYAYAYGIDAYDDTTNNGTIDVTATGTTAFAYGMYINESLDDNTITVNNFGMINVSASGTTRADAYQAYVTGGTANVGTWALKLGETYGKGSSTTPGVGYYVFGVGSGGKLNFGVDGKGANFIISGLGEDFEPGKEYKIKDMVGGNTGNASGYIASATSPYDFFPAELIGPKDYAQQSIKATINITADNSPTHGAATQFLANLKGHMSGLGKVIGNQRGNIGGADGLQAAKSETSTMYADASTTVTDAGGSYFATESLVWRAFLMPFYSTTSDNGGAYDTNMTGLVAGAHRNMNDDFVFGFHVSLAKANGEGTYTDSDTLSYALGINGVYNIDKSLYVRGQLTGFFAENDFDMVSSTGPWGHNASAEMDTYGVYAELAAGYDIVLAPQHMLTPELALSYMYAHMEGFDADFVGGISSPTSFSMASENYDALYADASVRWTGTYDLGMSENGNNFGILKPTVRAGIRQALADPEVSSTMNVFGTSATTHADANETSFTCEAGLAWTLDALTLSAIYSGEFGDVEYSHMGMFKVEWEF